MKYDKIDYILRGFQSCLETSQVETTLYLYNFTFLYCKVKAGWSQNCSLPRDDDTVPLNTHVSKPLVDSLPDKYLLTTLKFSVLY